jgi:2-polyprenyl-3-methyl-5-hydroxy-6-metoxy-1,4-benzoquinol methylase
VHAKPFTIDVREPSRGYTAVVVRTIHRPAASPTTLDVYVVRRRESVYRWFAVRCAKDGRRTVLDAGCREGYGAALLAAAGLDVTAADGDQRRIEAARRTYRFGRIRFVNDEPDDVDAPDGSFDAVLSVGTLERMSDPSAFLHELRRLVRPGGLVVLATTNRLTSSPGRTRPIEAEHVWEFTPDELHRLLGSHLPGERMLGVFHGRRLRLVENILGGQLQLTSVRLAPADRSFWLRAALRGMTSADFVVSPGAVRDALDLVAVCTR